MSLVSSIVPITSFLTLLTHIVLVLFALGLTLRISFMVSIRRFLAKNVLELSFLISTSALVGSLLYSEVLLFNPCILCWIERTLIYPQVVIAGLAIYFKEKIIGKYLIALSVIGATVSLYHSWTQLGGFSIIPCTSEGGSCSVLYVLEYGYITIPMMAFTAFALIITVVLCYMYEARKNFLNK